MLLYFSIIGLSTFVSIFIHLRMNPKFIVYKIVGIITILIAGAFACFVLLYPFYFGGYNHLISSIVWVAVLLVGIFIAAHMIIIRFKTAKNEDNAAKPPRKDKKKPQIKISSYQFDKNEKYNEGKSVKIKSSKKHAGLPKKENILLSKIDEQENDSIPSILEKSIQEKSPAKQTIRPESKEQDIIQSETIDVIEVIVAEEEPETVDAVESVVPKKELETVDAVESIIPEEEPETIETVESVVPEEEPETIDAVESVLPEPESAIDTVESVLPEEEPEAIETVESVISEEEPETIDAVESVVPEPEFETVETVETIVPEPEVNTIDAIEWIIPEAEPETVDAIESVVPEEEPETVDTLETIVPEPEPETVDTLETIVPEPEPETVDAVESIIPEEEPETIDAVESVVPEEEPETIDAVESVVPEPEFETVETVETIVPEPEVNTIDAIEWIIPEAEPETVDAIESVVPEPEPDTVETVESDIPEEEPDTVYDTDSIQQRDSKYIAIISKASELAKESKHLYAIQLLQICLDRCENRLLQKQAEILLIECLVFSHQHELAQKKLFDLLNKKYELELDDKTKLKEIMIKLKTVNA